MAGLCSEHQVADPACKLCRAHPRDLFPDWDERVKTFLAASRNGHPKPVVILDVKSVEPGLASEILWFVNEWCKATGWTDPRMKNVKDGFIVYARPPVLKGDDHEHADT